jgi:ferrous iron transport protein B
MRTIAVIGNPNTGKTALFNALTGLRQKVANYPGVTVEKKEGRVLLTDGSAADLLDLPGMYSLAANAPDERIATDVLLGRMNGTAEQEGVTIDVTRLQEEIGAAVIPTVATKGIGLRELRNSISKH